jgi:hypothetical protein
VTNSSPFLVIIAVSVVVALIVTGVLTAIVRPGPSDTCLTASEWANATQEMYYIGNDPKWGLDELARRDALHDQFAVMSNVVLPPLGSDSKSQLLPLLHRHNSEMEFYISYQLSIDLEKSETARLQLNETIRTINSLLVSECDIQPVKLHQSRPTTPNN